MSTRVTFRKIGASSSTPSNRLKKLFPYGLSPVKGRSVCEHRAAPGTILSFGPHKMDVNRSVVGSGPTRIPGKSRPAKYLMNEVLPTLRIDEEHTKRIRYWLLTWAEPIAAIRFSHTCTVPTARPSEELQNQPATRAANESDHIARKFPVAKSFCDTGVPVL